MATTSIPLTLVDILYKYWPLGKGMVSNLFKYMYIYVYIRSIFIFFDFVRTAALTFEIYLRDIFSIYRVDREYKVILAHHLIRRIHL